MSADLRTAEKIAQQFCDNLVIHFGDSWGQVSLIASHPGIGNDAEYSDAASGAEDRGFSSWIKCRNSV